MTLLTIQSNPFGGLNTNGITSSGKQSETLGTFGTSVKRATQNTIHISKPLTLLRIDKKEVVLTLYTN